VTERTFFRYFPDKREALFEGEEAMRAALIAEIAGAPANLGPLDTLFRAFKVLAPEFERNRSLMKPRFRIISTSPPLQEREGAKQSQLADALATALQKRGASRLRAALAAQAAVAGLTQSTLAWLEDPSIGHAERLDLIAEELKTLLAENALADRA
jgi:AcrR family transcriptional regulator